MSIFRKQSNEADSSPDAPDLEYEVDGVEVPASDIDLGTIDESDDAGLVSVGAGRSHAGSATAGRLAHVPQPTVERRPASFQFLHEVNVEMRKVAWPTKIETINYSSVVLVTLAVLMALIFGLDLGFSKLAFALFK